jgi:cell division protein ZipA
MTELRWVLLALGAVIILAVYLWGRGLPQRLATLSAALKRPKPEVSAPFEPAIADDEAPEPETEDVEHSEQVSEPVADSVVTLRLIPREKTIGCGKVMLALRAAGLRHGRYGIFHMHASELDDEPMFSVANLTEPGSFDLSKLSETTIPGMSFFMVLPGRGDPVDRFDLMVATARGLARELDGELHDEKGSFWSIQRERYVREEVIEYRHLLDRPSPD